MKIYPSLVQYIEAVSTFAGRARSLPCLEPLLDDSGQPIYRTKGSMVYFPMMDACGAGYSLGLFLNKLVRSRFSVKPDECFLEEEFFVHTTQGDDYVDVVIRAESLPELSFGAVAVDDSRLLCEGRRAFKDDRGLYGFVNEADDIVIRAQWGEVGDFAEGRAMVCRGGLFGLIDIKGNYVIETVMDELSWDGSQYAYVERDGRWGVFDRGGMQVLQMEWEWVSEFLNGYFLVQREQLFGYADGRGEIVIKPKYNDAGSFNEFGAAWVRLDDKEFFIDIKERRV